MTTDRKSVRWPLLVFTGLAFALRVWRLGRHELRGDEAFGLLFSSQPLDDMIAQTVQFLEPHPPLDYILLNLWTQVFGDSEWAIRLTSVVFSVLAVPLVFHLGRLLVDDEVGLWASVLFAVNPFQIWHAQEARMYAISTALGLAASVALLRAERTGSRSAWIGFVLLSVTNAYTHYYALFIIVAQGLYWLVTWRYHQGQWRTWLASQVAIVVLYLPWLVVGWHVLMGYHGNGDSPAFFDMIRRVLAAFSLGQTIQSSVSTYLLPVIALVFVAGWVVLIRWSARSAVFAALYLCVPVLGVFVSSLSRPVFNERYLIAATPPFLVVIASALGGLPHLVGRWGRVVTAIFAAVLIGGNLYSLYGYFIDPMYARSPGWRELAARLEEVAGPEEIIIQNYPDPTLWYYYSGDTPHVVLPPGRPLDEHETIKALERTGEDHDRIWFLPQKATDWDSDGFVGTWLDRHWERDVEEKAGSFSLRSYLPSRIVLAEATPVEARWDEQIALHAYLLESAEGGEPVVTPGEAISLTLFWEALRVPSADYTVFVHLLGPSGQIVAQKDSQPLRGSYPTSAWRAAEIISDRYAIIVPADAPGGDYSLTVGLYDASTGARLPVGAYPDHPLDDHYDLGERILVETR